MKRRLRSNDGSVVERYVNGSSGRSDVGSHAFMPKPARLRNVFIIRGLYDCRTRLLSGVEQQVPHGERLTEVGQDPAHAPIVLAAAPSAASGG